MDKHNQIHNDIKPQNYLVKFLRGKNELTSIEIVLTDFGLAGSDSKGGTPIFSSPECLANPDRKNKSTDIFSLGRVFLFTILPKEKFLQFLFVSLIEGGKNKIMESIEKQPILNLITKMMQIQNRMNLKTIPEKLKPDVPIIEYIPELFKNYTETVEEISETIQKSTSEYTNQYIDALKQLISDDFHRQLRNELIMIPIPKFLSTEYNHEAPLSQGHHLKMALERVSW